MPASTVEEALKQANLYTDDETYYFISLPPRAIVAAAGVVAEAGQVFSALLADKDEVTLMLRQDVYDEFSKRLIDHSRHAETYRLITFDVELDSGLVGFMARISQALADHGVSIMPFAAASRDHIFITSGQFETAMNCLNQLKSSVSP